MSRSFMNGFAAEPAGGELAVEVPQRQAVARPSRSGWRAAVLQRVDVGHQVPAHPVGVDQLPHRASCLISSSWRRRMSAQRIGS